MCWKCNIQSAKTKMLRSRADEFLTVTACLGQKTTPYGTGGIVNTQEDIPWCYCPFGIRKIPHRPWATLGQNCEIQTSYLCRASHFLSSCSSLTPRFFSLLSGNWTLGAPSLETGAVWLGKRLLHMSIPEASLRFHSKRWRFLCQAGVILDSKDEFSGA